MNFKGEVPTGAFLFYFREKYKLYYERQTTLWGLVGSNPTLFLFAFH